MNLWLGRIAMRPVRVPVTFNIDVFVRFADTHLGAAVGRIISGAVLRSGPPFYGRGHDKRYNTVPSFPLSLSPSHKGHFDANLMLAAAAAAAERHQNKAMT